MHANEYVAMGKDIAESKRHLDNAIPRVRNLLMRMEEAQQAANNLLSVFVSQEGPTITERRGLEFTNEYDADRVEADIRALTGDKEGQP